jgi:hypothetical protein
LSEQKIVGPAEGDELGSNEGSIDGLLDGTNDGGSDGLNDGTPLGATLGDELGSSEGLADGIDDGLSDGRVDGLAEGDTVGLVDGLKVSVGVKEGLALSHTSSQFFGQFTRYALSESVHLFSKEEDDSPAKSSQVASLPLYKKLPSKFSQPPVPIAGLEEGLSLSHSSLQYSGQFSIYSGILHLFVNFWDVMPCKLEQ